MKREEMLTKLAMELAEWPVSDTLNVRPKDNGNGPIRWSWVYPEAGFSKEEWLAERERLINKLSWEDLPGWVTHIAQDEDGLWHGYANEPELDFGSWAGDMKARDYATCRKGAIPAGHEWESTLEQRQYTEPEPKDWSGEGLPPVGTVCEAQLDSGRWAEAEILAHYRPCQYGREVAVFAFSPSKESPNRIVTQLIAGQFRPLRSEEDRAVDDMIMKIGDVRGKAESVRRSVARRLYRAGYRKVAEGGSES